jgi:hypothetical protein
VKRTIIAFSIVSILAGCGSVPLGTMWRMRNFSIQDVAAIDPNELRARIISPDFVPTQEGGRLDIGFLDNDSNDMYAFPLEIIDRKEETKGMFQKRVVRTTTFKLTPEAVDAFVRFRELIRADERKHRKVRINVFPAFEPIKMEEEPKVLEISILLKLKAEENYITLINKARIDFNKMKSEQEKPPEENVEDAKK